MTPVDTDVCVVGAGPTGLVLAALLGALGIRTLVLEQHPSTTDEPRAVSVDDETLRVLYRAGLADVVDSVLLPGTGTRYVDAASRTLFYARGPEPPPFGHPLKSPFHQPDLERSLYRGLERYPSVTTRFSTTVESLSQTENRVVVGATTASGRGLEVRTQYLVGCDGGKSRVRQELQIAMRGLSYDEQWLVVDTVGDSHNERYGIHVADPRRPHVIIPGRDGQCRYEFRLQRDETTGAVAPFELIERLVEPYRAIEPTQVVRHTVYRFHALVADRWSVGRCFLAGDAAHMMPPFAGQGLNSGIRDVDNLAWKLASVVRGAAPPVLLDSYEVERRPHAESMVALSTRLGRVVMTTRPLLARVRDTLLRASCAIPPVARWFTEMRFRPRPVYLTGAVQGTSHRHEAVGRLFPQPAVLGPDGHPVRLDDLLGDWMSIVCVDPPDQIVPRAVAEIADRIAATIVVLVSGDRMARRGPHHAAALTDERTSPELLGLRGHNVLVRPDRFVAAVSEGADVAALRDWASSWCSARTPLTDVIGATA